MKKLFKKKGTDSSESSDENKLLSLDEIHTALSDILTRAENTEELILSGHESEVKRSEKLKRLKPAAEECLKSLTSTDRAELFGRCNSLEVNTVSDIKNLVNSLAVMTSRKASKDADKKPAEQHSSDSSEVSPSHARFTQYQSTPPSSERKSDEAPAGIEKTGLPARPAPYNPDKQKDVLLGGTYGNAPPNPAKPSPKKSKLPEPTNYQKMERLTQGTNVRPKDNTYGNVAPMSESSTSNENKNADQNTARQNSSDTSEVSPSYGRCTQYQSTPPSSERASSDTSNADTSVYGSVPRLPVSQTVDESNYRQIPNAPLLIQRGNYPVSQKNEATNYTGMPTREEEDQSNQYVSARTAQARDRSRNQPLAPEKIAGKSQTSSSDTSSKQSDNLARLSVIARKKKLPVRRGRQQTSSTSTNESSAKTEQQSTPGKMGKK